MPARDGSVLALLPFIAIVSFVGTTTDSGFLTGLPAPLVAMRYHNHLWASVALAAPILALNSLRSLPEGFDPLHKPCPRSCSENPSQADWTSYYSVDRLTVCGEPMLLTFATFYDLEDPDTLLKIRTCTAGDAETSVNALTEASITESVASSSPPPVCYEAAPVNATAEWITWAPSHGRRNTNSSGSYEDILTSLRNTQTFLKDALNCEESIVYGYSRGTVVGVYAGPKIQNRGIATGFVQDTIDRLVAANKGAPSRMVAQVCGGDLNSDNHLGIVIDPFGDLAWAQKALRSWSEAKCVAKSASQGAAETSNHGITVPTIMKKIESRAMLRTKPLSAKSDCHKVQAVYGDTIKSLASSCQVSVRDFSRYNNLPADWTPSPYQWVCCSSGVTRRATDPRPDGTCASYIVQNQDTCSIIANKQGIRQGDLYAYNQETYGWGGCNSLYPGMRICVGPGTPRLPAPNKDAVCGPTKPGTENPVGDEKIEDLSPCPIKACCNIWGNCGVDIDFCVPTESETGNPGTAKPNTNGCVQNCGLELVTGPPPSDFIKVGYFESWNSERPCLHMSPKDIPSSYTHVHYAFADVTTDYTVSLGKFADVFEEFKALKGRKRIVAFGGWAFSTEPATYQYFRQGTKPENREKFAAACVDFVVSEGLDGIDFDWEYPGEPDIPGIPPGDEDESENYLEFVKIIRAKMPADKTVSIAAPASYWYLKQFLIEEMSEFLDYIVYMTYDLHGQWDYSNEWSQSGCKAGNCLRSHVNMTETMSALVMVTKAGVPSDKIVVGVTSYGRSFRMTDPSCTGPLCTYTGPDSGATPGRCTKTGGYISNSEINELIANGGATRDWVAYMDDANKESRIAKYKSLNFRGSSDWAIDLQTDFG
ncbi:glycoside hydrolase superfamily [Xylaria scruposa]|nr:glycoside hydrolase superfamily [Xylaria scruposa]